MLGFFFLSVCLLLELSNSETQPPLATYWMQHLPISNSRSQNVASTQTLQRVSYNIQKSKKGMLRIVSTPNLNGECNVGRIEILSENKWVILNDCKRQLTQSDRDVICSNLGFASKGSRLSNTQQNIVEHVSNTPKRKSLLKSSCNSHDVFCGNCTQFTFPSEACPNLNVSNITSFDVHLECIPLNSSVATGQSCIKDTTNIANVSVDGNCAAQSFLPSSSPPTALFSLEKVFARAIVGIAIGVLILCCCVIICVSVGFGGGVFGFALCCKK